MGTGLLLSLFSKGKMILFKEEGGGCKGDWKKNSKFQEEKKDKCKGAGREG